MSTSKIAIIYFFLLILSAAGNAHGTTVSMWTNLGRIDVALYDDIAPKTVANFLTYVNDGDYTNAIFHRSIPGFIIQNGGFVINGNAIVPVPVDPPVENEFSVSNTRGTIAMAKVSGDPDSATSQWFFNLGDNSANLDNQNGGFTVFGQALAQSMDVIDAIAALTVYNASEIHFAFGNLPLLEISGKKYYVIINSITIIGDMNGDRHVDLADTILILKILTGLTPSSDISKTAYMTDDKKIGLKEAVYTLQVISGIRSK